MIEQILMGASAVITLSACYCGWHYANKAQYLRDLLAEARGLRDDYCEGVDYWISQYHKSQDRLDCLENENDRLSDLVAKYQAKKPLRTSDGKFASKRAAKTAELREYVASKAAL